MTHQQQSLYALIREIRTSFNYLKALAGALHRGTGVNPSMRAIMECLHDGGLSTVPDIARRKAVSRQHVQNIMNALIESELAEPVDNPAHKRSSLFDLTGEGRATFTRIRQHEREPLRRLAAQIPNESIEQAVRVLKMLNRAIDAEVSRGDGDA
ncbi:MAG: MarR family transcriptional regulator [Proteobacteria bacterium]|nr:MAG: MarR family transcriptional regulator [Pseudomonadota bacterium]